MPRKQTQMIVVNGRPSDFSDDLMNEIMKHLQEGKTLWEIGQIKGMPTFRTLANWRHTKPEFFHVLTAVEEDMTREARRDMRNTTDILKKGVAGLTPIGAIEHYAAVKGLVDSIDKVAKVQIVKGDPPPVVDRSDDIEDQRRAFAELHPMTQERIRQALLEERMLRGETEESEE